MKTTSLLHLFTNYKVFLTAVLFFTALRPGHTQQRYEFESRQMGTTFHITLYAGDDSTARSAADSAFQEIETLNSILSDYMEESELNSLSDASGSGKAIAVSEPLYALLHQSVEISKATDGWFDITIGPYSHIWRGLNRMTNPSLPDSSELSDARSGVGYTYIHLLPNRRSVELQADGMRLDPGGIGKGFAADRALDVLRKYGISSALINAGGDITAGDPPPGKTGWSVAIPVQVHQDSVFFEEVHLVNESLNTSGSLYQSVEIEGENYSHIINPKTGLGHTEQVQVSVRAPDGAGADAFATALSVMPRREAMEFVESNRHLEALIFWMDGNNSPDRWASSGFETKPNSSQ